MASTFLTRLKVGPKLVDAKGVNRLYRQGVRRSATCCSWCGRAGRHAGDLAVSEPVRPVWSDLIELLQVFFNRVRSLLI